jgi:hypothetical protein
MQFQLGSPIGKLSGLGGIEATRDCEQGFLLAPNRCAGVRPRRKTWGVEKSFLTPFSHPAQPAPPPRRIAGR